jgi:FKBP-type peptidyl-prolyl cis-trans isomerase
MRRALIGGTALLAALAACTDDPAGLDCDDVPTAIAATRGDTVVTATGLRYIETRAGTGAVVENCEGVAVRYTGTLLDGTQFDAGTFPFTPGTQGVIPGFEQGVIGARVGAARRLIIPPELGYGSRPPAGSPIPANATLIFDVEVLEVEQ